MTDFLTNADHWRRRAERTRALAANAVKDQGRLLKVAEEYDRLAALARTAPKCSGPGRFLRSGKPARVNRLQSKNRREGRAFPLLSAHGEVAQKCAAIARCVTSKTQPPGNVQSIVIMRLQGNQRIA